MKLSSDYSAQTATIPMARPDHGAAHRSAPPGPGEVELVPAYVGICGTDLHISHGDMDARVTAPAVLRHETAGRILCVGPGVEGWRPGDAVTVLQLRWNGACPACSDGYQHICRQLDFIGIDSPGAMQPRWTVPASALIWLPDSLSLDQAALVEPTVVAVHDVSRAGVRDGERVVVVGGGPVGVVLALVAQAAGADVRVVELNAHRLLLAKELGLTVWDPANADITGLVQQWTGQGGTDVAFEVSGAAGGLDTVVDVLGVRDRLCLVAVHPRPHEINLHRFFWRTRPRRRQLVRPLRLRAGRRPGSRRHRPRPATHHQDRAAHAGAGRLRGTGEQRRRDEGPGGLHRRGPGGCRINAFDLTGRLAVATGARRGIGRAMAHVLAEVGANVMGVSALLEESGSAVEKDVTATDRAFEAIRTDFAVPEAVRALGADINLSAQFVPARAFGPSMVARGWGKVIFTASLLNFQGGITIPGNTAAKHSVAGLTKALANGWAPQGVKVNAIAPGYIATDNTQALQDDPVRSSAILNRIPATARWGSAEDLVGPTVFLASPASDYIHGTVLPVDGGWLGR
jgi:(R,R)-butanediol dehydrogenase/meso-butanediol dehydrogenase/diacetyl reductase